MLVSILVFILVLSVLIISHEFGHFIVARKSGIKVEEFGFGLPPRLFSKKIGETVYSINALPFGGFVRLHGEQEEDEGTNVKHSFLHKSKKVRAMVVIAGVVMNFLLAIIVFAIVYSFSGIPRDGGKVKVIDVASGSPAANAGIVVGDIITKVGGETIVLSDEFVAKTATYKGKRVTYEVQRDINGQQWKFIIRPYCSDLFMEFITDLKTVFFGVKPLRRGCGVYCPGFLKERPLKGFQDRSGFMR